MIETRRIDEPVDLRLGGEPSRDPIEDEVEAELELRPEVVSRRQHVLEREPGQVRELVARGPLSDGKLTADELLAAQLAAASPARAEPTRYAVEGYGFFGDQAQTLVEHVLAGRAELPERTADDIVYSAALTARQAATTATGCS